MIAMLLDHRSRDVLFSVISTYLESRLPVGSRTLSKKLPQTWSPATLRNIMSDLEDQDLLTAPHRSAGRVPTPKALRFYIKHMDPEGLSKDIEEKLSQSLAPKPSDTREWLDVVGEKLAELSQCATIVFLSPRDPVIQSIDFVPMAIGKAIAVLVTRCGHVEHRLIDIPSTIRPEQLQEASNYLNARFSGYTMTQMRKHLDQSLHAQKNHLSDLMINLLHKNIVWETEKGHTVIKGQSQLLEDVQDLETLQSVKALFSWLETQETFQSIFEQVCKADEVQLVVGKEHPLFDVGECSFLLSLYGSKDDPYAGGIGIVGPLYMDYRRIIPMIDGTINLIERMYTHE